MFALGGRRFQNQKVESFWELPRVMTPERVADFRVPPWPGRVKSLVSPLDVFLLVLFFE